MELFRVRCLLDGSSVTWRWPACGTIGIDIGQQAVALVAVRHAAAGPRVEEVAAAELPPGALHGHAVREPGAVGEAIRRLGRRRVVLRRWPVVTAVPVAGTMMRRLVVAPPDGTSLETAVAEAAGSVIPEGVAHAVLDYHVLQVTSGATEVLAVAARAELVRSYTAAVRAAGFEPAAVDVDVLAVCRAWTAGDAGAVASPAVFVHAGARGVSVTVLRGDVPTVGGDVPAPPGVDPEALGAAVARAIDVLLPAPADRQCPVVVWGAAARVARLAPVLEAHLRAPVAVADPFAAGPAFAVAAGLALRAVERSWW